QRRRGGLGHLMAYVVPVVARRGAVDRVAVEFERAGVVHRLRRSDPERGYRQRGADRRDRGNQPSPPVAPTFTIPTFHRLAPPARCARRNPSLVGGYRPTETVRAVYPQPNAIGRKGNLATPKSSAAMTARCLAADFGFCLAPRSTVAPAHEGGRTVQLGPEAHWPRPARSQI